MRKWAILGVYGGIVTTGTGPYVLELSDMEGNTIRVDTEGKDTGAEIYGMINEDIHGGGKECNDMG